MDAPPISDYLHDFYSPQGRIELEYFVGALYTLCECEICGMLFQQHIPNEDLLHRLYEYWIDPNIVCTQALNSESVPHFAFFAQEIMQVISWIGRCPASLSFFDFGMGWGKWALMAKAFGCNSYGTELSQQRTAYATSNGITAIAWDDIPRYQFDFINTSQVFEHLADPLGTLRHLGKALKTGGLIKISVPNGYDINRRLRVMDWTAPKETRNSLNAVAPLEHINCFRRRTFKVMAQAVGMEETFLPMLCQYRYTTNWNGLKGTVRNLAIPIYRNVLKLPNYIFLRKTDLQ
jgi:2-polyprenyl-3-methyl-5-hydroxy-6-metoxy-1,4-benzoquinol methylase